MAKNSLNSSTHFRSISLPTTCQTISAQFDEHLSRLLLSKNATTSCSSLCQSVSTLVGLYECVDELLARPANQQVISRNCQAKWVDDVLEGSLKLLDVCCVSRDAFLQTKESLQGVQSLLRRRCIGELSIRKGVSEYINSRKKVKKGIRQCLKNTKKIDTVDRTCVTVSLDSVFRNVEIITGDVFNALLNHVAGGNTQSMSLVVRLMSRVSDIDKRRKPCSEFEDIDAQLRSFISRKMSRTQVEKTRFQMGKLEYEIEEIVEELECLFRHLVKTRVTLLNLFSN
ncbi:hypothetical protein RND81_14G204300 [Saponaria officinalis]|uniref:Uncharacterized protein n=1 Tax=Saponaria officinalis TaxID=3572 RepID=A0AAW1GSI1_SAPOF